MQATRIYLLFFAAIGLLTSCDHKVYTETTVHPDGSLDKTFVFENRDSIDNLFGLEGGNGWEKDMRLKTPKSDSAKDREWITTFKKHFASAEEANAELAVVNDTLFQVTSKFEKDFRWFYTYIRYSETFHSLNRMAMKPDNYLTVEDYAFIDRLPAEGKKISKADEYYLGKLNDRIFDDYGTQAYFDEYYALGLQALSDHGIEKRWLDTLRVHQRDVFQLLESKQDVEVDFLMHVFDSLGAPINEQAKIRFNQLSKKFESKVNFISNGSEGTYQTRVNMPWTVVKTNADSVAGNFLFWSPPSIKFLLKDYTMYGEARKLNIWAVVVSVLFVVATAVLLLKRRGARS